MKIHQSYSKYVQYHYFISNRLCEAAERHVLTKSHEECAVGINVMIVDGQKAITRKVRMGLAIQILSIKDKF